MIPAGTQVRYRITYLSMDHDPGFAAPGFPDGYRLDHAPDAPYWYFLSLYRAVGRDWEWQDRLAQTEERVRAFAEHPAVEVWTLQSRGFPQGFYMLDFRTRSDCDLAYFGMVPEAVGGGLGKRLLQSAIAEAWSRGIDRMTVNTCTLDHPRALGLYQAMGFQARRTEVRTRVLVRDRGLPLPVVD